MAEFDEANLRDQLFFLNGRITGIIGDTANTIAFSPGLREAALASMMIRIHEALEETLAAIGSAPHPEGIRKGETSRIPDMRTALCLKCRKHQLHRHEHQTAHGIEETHMVGSECWKCVECGNAIFKEDAKVYENYYRHLNFVLD